MPGFPRYVGEFTAIVRRTKTCKLQFQNGKKHPLHDLISTMNHVSLEWKCTTIWMMSVR